MNESVSNCAIKDAHSLYISAKDHFKNSEFFFVSEEKVKIINDEMYLDSREDEAKTIPGTHRLHHFTPIKGVTSHIKVKETSFEQYWSKEQPIKKGFRKRDLNSTEEVRCTETDV